jgi:predicted transcriptional regulator
MTPAIRKLLKQVESWPPEDQEELAEVARAIEARRTGVYVLSEDEKTAIEEGLRQLDRGEALTEEDMEPYWRRFGVV